MSEDGGDEAARRLAIEAELIADQAELTARREGLQAALRTIAYDAGALDAATARHRLARLAGIVDEVAANGDPGFAAQLHGFARFVLACQVQEFGTPRLVELQALRGR